MLRMLLISLMLPPLLLAEPLEVTITGNLCRPIQTAIASPTGVPIRERKCGSVSYAKTELNGAKQISISQRGAFRIVAMLDPGIHEVRFNNPDYGTAKTLLQIPKASNPKEASYSLHVNDLYFDQVKP